MLAPGQMALLALGAAAIALFSPCEEERVWCRHTADTGFARGCA